MTAANPDQPSIAGAAFLLREHEPCALDVAQAAGDLVASGREPGHELSTDESRRARDQDLHLPRPSSSRRCPAIVTREHNDFRAMR